MPAVRRAWRRGTGLKLSLAAAGGSAVVGLVATVMRSPQPGSLDTNRRLI